MPGSRAAEAVRRGQIIKAAYAVAGAKGLDAVTVRDIRARRGSATVSCCFTSRRRNSSSWRCWTGCSRPRRSSTSPKTSRGFRSPSTDCTRYCARRCTGCRASRAGFVCSSTSGRRGSGTGDSHEDAPGARPLRDAFRPMVEEVLRAEPERFAGVSAEGLSAVAVSFIKGCAVQAMIDPDDFDIEQYLTATEGLLARVEVVGRTDTWRPRRAGARPNPPA